VKKFILRYTFVFLLLIVCLLGSKASFGQTATFAALTGGLPGDGATINMGAARAVYGFSAAISGGGSITFRQFNINTNNDITGVFANGTLYRSTTSSYNSGSPGTPVGNVNFVAASNAVGIITSNLSETINSGSTNYYFLVVDVISNPGYRQLYVNNMVFATDINGTNYNSGGLNHYRGYQFTGGTSYAFRVTPTVAGLASTSNSLVAGSSDVAMFGFGVSASSTLNVTAIRINSNITSLSDFFSSFTLETTGTTSTYSAAATAVTTGVTVTMSAGYVNIAITGTNLQATTTTRYYWLVANVKSTGLGTLPVAPQFNFKRGQTNSSFTASSTNYNTATVHGPTYAINYANVTLTTQQNGISSGTLTAGQTDVVLFGFGASATSSIAVSQFNINSNGAASTYFGNARLYRNTTNNYSTGTKTLVGTGTFNGSYCNIVMSPTETLNTTEKYYFLVADNVGGVAGNVSMAFNFTSGQSTEAVVQTSPTSQYNTFSFTGNSFTIPAPTLIYANNTTGYTLPTTIVAGESAVICAFDARSFGNVTITSPYIDLVVSGTNPTGLFPAANIQVWVSTTGSFATANLITGTTANNGGSGIKIALPSTAALSSGDVYSVYIVATLTSSSALPTTRTISSGGILSDNSANDFPTTSLAQPSFNLVTGAVTIEGNNSAAAGITQGSLTYGQTNIVLYSYKLTARGAFTISTMSVPSNVSTGAYFNNGKLYRSTTPFFSDATLVNAATVGFGSGNSALLGAMNQTFTAGSATTYYYFIVADLLASTNGTETTVTFNFSPSQSPAAINSGNGSGLAFNGFTTTDGANHFIATIYKWKGGTSSDFSNLANFRNIQDGTVSSIGTNSIIEIGVESFTNAPTITANTTVGGIMFGNTGTPTLTIQAGRTLTINKSLNAANGANATITGTATSIINIDAAASSGVSNTLTAGSTLTLAGGVTVNNAGTFSVANLSSLNFSGGSTLNNTGTFTLRSGPNGSASIGALRNNNGTVTNGTLTGNFNVERYVTGGTLTYRGYRLLSSPVHSGATAFYDLGYLRGSGTYLTGSGGTTNGWDVSGNPTLYLYRPDRTPNNSSFTTGNFRPVTKINNSPNAYLTGTQDGNFDLGIGNGYLMFYRGNNGTLTTTIPNSLVLSASGVINQGDIQVKPWFTGNTTLDYTLLSGSTNSAVRGFNLVGNPYPSTIDWNTRGTSSTSGINVTNVATTIYVLDPVTQGYSTYNSQNGASTLNGSRYIPSGQGFFVLANGNNPQITFRENAKVTNQVSGNSLLLNTAANVEQDRHIRIQLYKDANVYDDLYIGFKQSASKAYVFNEDSPYKRGNGKVSFSSLSSDREDVAINYVPLPETHETIKLNFTVNGAGTYKLNTTELLNIPQLYDVWLHDNFTKDSLDIRANATYTFKTSADTASYGANRFKIVLRANTDKAVRLLSFSGAKNNTRVNLSWTVENEANHTNYSLERSVDGGKTYVVIDSILSANLGTYNDIDLSPAKGLNQYRLKQIDVLGRITYSAIVPVMYTEPADIKLANNIINLYPNPVNQTLNLAIAQSNNKSAAASYKISITSSAGYVVQTINTTNPNWQGDVSKLLPGTYFVQVINTKDNTVTGKSTFIKL
jgi:hypothetical protein